MTTDCLISNVEVLKRGLQEFRCMLMHKLSRSTRTSVNFTYNLCKTFTDRSNLANAKLFPANERVVTSRQRRRRRRRSESRREAGGEGRERETKSGGNCHEHVIEEQFNHKTNNEAAGRDRRKVGWLLSDSLTSFRRARVRTCRESHLLLTLSWVEFDSGVQPSCKFLICTVQCRVLRVKL